MLWFTAAVVLAVLGTLGYLLVSTHRRPSRAAQVDAQMRRDCIQLSAHVLAANDTGWAIPDHVVELAHKILATKEIHQ